jgi:hypothetical protein
LAGVVAVALVDALERRRVLVVASDRAFEVPESGLAWWQSELSIDVASIASSRRAFARRCLDWTERRPHLAGALGAAVLDRFVAMKWAARTDSRTVRITTKGAAGLAKIGVSWPA